MVLMSVHNVYMLCMKNVMKKTMVNFNVKNVKSMKSMVFLNVKLMSVQIVNISPDMKNTQVNISKIKCVLFQLDKLRIFVIIS